MAGTRASATTWVMRSSTPGMNSEESVPPTAWARPRGCGARRDSPDALCLSANDIAGMLDTSKPSITTAPAIAPALNSAAERNLLINPPADDRRR